MLPAIHYATHADLGQRLFQEDAFVADPALGLFAVADAMGAMMCGRRGCIGNSRRASR
jgi:hypothetical protein